jgi:hypothetical protein
LVASLSQSSAHLVAGQVARERLLVAAPLVSALADQNASRALAVAQREALFDAAFALRKGGRAHLEAARRVRQAALLADAAGQTATGAAAAASASAAVSLRQALLGVGPPVANAAAANARSALKVENSLAFVELAGLSVSSKVVPSSLSFFFPLALSCRHLVHLVCSPRRARLHPYDG